MEFEKLSNSLRLTVRHFPSYIEKDKSHPTGQKRCIVCTTGAKKIANKGSRFECEGCNVGFCINDCFQVYHIKTNF